MIDILELWELSLKSVTVRYTRSRFKIRRVILRL